MTTNDKPVCYQIRCIDARIPGVWGSHDCAETRDLLAKSWDERGVKYETRDLYARPQPAAPQVPEGMFLDAVSEAAHRWPDSVEAIIFLACAVGPTAKVTEDDLRWALQQIATPPAPEQGAE